MNCFVINALVVYFSECSIIRFLITMSSVCVTAPVSLKVRHKHLDHKEKTVRFNISCNGRYLVCPNHPINSPYFAI